MGRHKSIRETLQTSGLTPLLKATGKAGCLKPLKVPGVPHISAVKQHGLQAPIWALCLIDGSRWVWNREASSLWIFSSVGSSFSLADFLTSQYSRLPWWLGWTIWVPKESPQEFDPARYCLTSSSSSTCGSSSNSSSRCWGWVVADRRKAAGGGLPNTAYLPTALCSAPLCPEGCQLSWGRTVIIC